MAKNKLDVKQKTVAELKTYVKELRTKLNQLRLDYAVGKLKATSSLTHTRKDIAKALTALKEKEVKNG